MTTGSLTLKKLFDSKEHAKVGDNYYWVIPEAGFSQQEIEELRGLNISFRDCNGSDIIANFLPDDVRPSNIPKL